MIFYIVNYHCVPNGTPYFLIVFLYQLSVPNGTLSNEMHTKPAKRACQKSI